MRLLILLLLSVNLYGQGYEISFKQIENESFLVLNSDYVDFNHVSYYHINRDSILPCYIHAMNSIAEYIKSDLDMQYLNNVKIVIFYKEMYVDLFQEGGFEFIIRTKPIDLIVRDWVGVSRVVRTKLYDYFF